MAAVNCTIDPGDLSELVRYLGHYYIAIKSKAIGEKGLQEGHFTAIEINKAEDFIAHRNGKRQLWINLQKLKPKVAGEYINFADIESYKNIYIDLDCERPEGMKDYAATEAERTKALSLLPVLKDWLKSHGLKSGLELHTGNGCGMLLPIPETKAEPVFIAKLATFLKMVKVEIPGTDIAMFDPPRVIGIPGTLNVKLETTDRENHMREFVGAMPERVEDQALLDLINSLEPDPVTLESYRAKYGEPEDAPHQEQKEAPHMPEDVAERLQELFTAEPSFKAKFFTPAPKGKRSTHEYALCARLWEAGFSEAEIYSIMDASPQTKWQERNDGYKQSTIKSGIDKAKANHKAAMGQTLPMIVMSGRQLRDVSSEVLEALVAAQEGDPCIFERTGRLCRIRFDENGSCSISSFAKDEEFRGVIGRVADFCVLTLKGDEIPKPPSMDVVKDILYGMGRWDGIKPLLITVDSPVLRADGSILMDRGYDEASRLYYSTTAPIDIAIPEFSQKAAIEAIEWLKNEVLVDFPFVDDAGLANALAALITPCLRPTIEGCVPFYVIDKPTPGCGASLLAEVICLINTGKNAEMGGKSHDDEEMGKNITAILRRGPRIAVLDNMTGVFGYANFSRMLTSRLWQERLLGKHESLSLPNLTCWVGTANNVKFGGDIARRKYTSRIDPHMARPQDRTGFKHPRLELWVIEHRSEILSRILTICASWFAAGRPASTVKPIGSFEEWTAVLSGVLEYAGVVGFLDNRTNTDLDVDDTELADFFACRYAVHQNREVTANVLTDDLTNLSALGPMQAFQRAMPRDLSKALAKGGLSANPIRYFLRSYRDRIFSNGFQLVGSKADKSGNKQATWRVIPPQTVAADIPSHRATQYGMNGIVSLNVREKEDISMDGGGINPVYPVNVPPAMTGCDSIAVSEEILPAIPSPDVDNTEADAKPMSIEDVVAHIDQNMTEIETPVLHDYLDKCGWSYIEAIGKLEKRGWTLNYAARIMTKEVIA